MSPTPPLPEDRPPLAGAVRREPPPELEAKLHEHLTAFRRRVDAHAYYAVRPLPLGARVARAASALGVAGLVLAALLTLFGGGATPSWAEVVERFDAVPFFNATIYFKDHATAEPVQLELWMGQKGRWRLRCGNRVLFGRDGAITQTFTIESAASKRSERRFAQDMVEAFIRQVGGAQAFSFETLVTAFPIQGTMSPPLPSHNAGIANDLVVFDMSGVDGPEWARIWALRESRLPVRVLFWDPRYAGSADIALSYANRQPPDFFDPDAFRRTQAAYADDAAAQAYSLLEDPGGQPLTPTDVQAAADQARRDTPAT